MEARVQWVIKFAVDMGNCVIEVHRGRLKSACFAREMFDDFFMIHFSSIQAAVFSYQGKVRWEFDFLELI